MEIILLLSKIAFCTLLVLLVLNNLYLLIFSIAASLKPGNDVKPFRIKSERKFLVLFPAYKEDAVIVDSVANFIRQDYPNYRLYVIADSLKPETIDQLIKLNVSVCALPEMKARNKANAINYLLSTITENYDACVIMDADNHVKDDFLLELNGYFNAGALAVQTQRVSKNKNNSLSKLDTISEIINNHIFRKGQRALGFSSSLIGSGMAFEMNLFKEVMADMDVFSGFDKELELRLLERKITIVYAENILTYDEKVEQEDVFVNQRRRWLFAQLHFLRANSFNAFIKVLSGGYWDYVNKVIQFSLLPRILSIGVSLLMVAIAIFLSLKLFIVSIVNMLVLFLAIALPVFGSFKLSEIIKLSIRIPGAFVNMLNALLSSNRAAGKFLHTPHNSK
jgi:cellulose synthase/poly-beta-1,6-N-acetylglucosamine synthase-like glycosyltransferase